MFSFAFRKKTVDLQPYVRRIVDRTTPNLSTSATSARVEKRYNRSVPVLLCPWQNDLPSVDDCSFAITQDFSDRSVGVITAGEFPSTSVLVGFWIPACGMEEPWFFLGEAKRNVPIGGGFWILGIEFQVLANAVYAAKIEPLLPLAEDLRVDGQ